MPQYAKRARKSLRVRLQSIDVTECKRGSVLLREARKTHTHLLLAHPVVDLLSVPVEKLQVHALFILLSAQLPQLQQRLFLLCQNAQLHTQRLKVTYTPVLQSLPDLFKFDSLKDDSIVCDLTWPNNYDSNTLL